MLEVGCSYGAMLDAFRRDGWEVEGIELDARAAQIAQSSYALRVHHGRLEEVRHQLLGDYDAIMLYHVLEHVADPAALIRDLAARCRSGGVILLKTPNPRSFAARVLAGWWQWYAAPEHVRLFSPNSLRTLLETEGFAPELIMSRRGDAHRTLFELARGLARRALQRGVQSEVDLDSPGSNGIRPLSQRPWYRALHIAIDTVGAPLGWMLSPLQARPYLLGPELLVLARKVRQPVPQ
jgi:SAM-dependent methyltransferase